MVVLLGRRGSRVVSLWIQRNLLFVMALLACLSSSSPSSSSGWWNPPHLSLPIVEGWVMIKSTRTRTMWSADGCFRALFLSPRPTTTTTTTTTRVVDPSGGSSRLYAASDETTSNDDNNDDDNEEDEEEETIKPYGRRSLAWTQHYRRLIPYHVARAQAVAMGMTTPEDYQRWRRGPYQIQRPEEMYALEWISWDEFLGTMRTYDDTRHVVRLLQLQSMEEYHEFVRQDPKRAEGLRIPARPDIVYKDCGWENDHLFFFGGTSDIDVTNQED